MTRPRVCIVRQTDLYEIPVKRQAEALAEAGYQVEVLCMRSPDRPRRTVVNGVEVTSLPASLGRSSGVRYALDYAWFFVLAGATLTRRHLRRRYAVIQVNTMPDFLVFSAVAPKLLGTRVLAYMNEPSPELAETLFGSRRLARAMAWVEQRALRYADHAVTVTEQLKQRYVERGARADDITVVLNGAAPQALLTTWTPPPPAPRSHFTIVCHGSIEDRYGQDTIVEAVRLLRDELPDLRVVFTGRGSYVETLLRTIREEGLDDIISFEGWVDTDRLYDLLHTAAAGIVAQKASPYSHLVSTNKMVDYWIFGLPVIASRLRAVSEMYGDDVLEYYEPGDPVDLARAIRRLHDDPFRHEALAAGGRTAQEQNGWMVQRQRYLRVYDGLLGRNGASG